MSATDDTTVVPLTIHYHGRQRLIRAEKQFYNLPLLNSLALAFYWQSLLDQQRMPSLRAIAREEKVDHSVVVRLFRLTLLAPDVIEQCVQGEQPRRLSTRWLSRDSIPTLWSEQRKWVHNAKGIPA